MDGLVIMLCDAMCICKHKKKENLGTFESVFERLEACGKRLNVFRAFLGAV